MDTLQELLEFLNHMGLVVYDWEQVQAACATAGIELGTVIKYDREAVPMAQQEGTCRECVHYHWVQAHPHGTSRSGPGCLLTGGHADRVCSHFDRGESYDD